MHPYLSTFFESDHDLEDHLFYGERSFGKREDFIIGLYGMTAEATMIKWQHEFTQFLSVVSHCVNYWTENFKKTDVAFKNLWTTEEWALLIVYETEFISSYRKLTYWKHEPPKAPVIFKNATYQLHRKLTIKLFEQLI